jgi:hypothetical protein
VSNPAPNPTQALSGASFGLITLENMFEYFCAVSAPFRPLIERVQEKDWPLIRAAARREIERYRIGDEIRFGAHVVFASASA